MSILLRVWLILPLLLVAPLLLLLQIEVATDDEPPPVPVTDQPTDLPEDPA